MAVRLCDQVLFVIAVLSACGKPSRVEGTRRCSATGRRKHGARGQGYGTLDVSVRRRDAAKCINKKIRQIPVDMTIEDVTLVNPTVGSNVLFLDRVTHVREIEGDIGISNNASYRKVDEYTWRIW